MLMFSLAHDSYVGDIQIPLACDMFVNIRGRELLSKNLYKNFIMHMCNLYDFGLIPADVHLKIVEKLQRMLAAHEAGRHTIAASRRDQLSYWQRFGLARQQQKLRDEKSAAATVEPTSSSKPAMTTTMTTTTTASSRTTATLASASLSSSAAATSLPTRLTSAANLATKNATTKTSQHTSATTQRDSHKTRSDVVYKPKPGAANGSAKTAASSAAVASSSSAPSSSSSSSAGPTIGNKRRFSHLRG